MKSLFIFCLLLGVIDILPVFGGLGKCLFGCCSTIDPEDEIQVPNYPKDEFAQMLEKEPDVIDLKRNIIAVLYNVIQKFAKDSALSDSEQKAVEKEIINDEGKIRGFSAFGNNQGGLVLKAYRCMTKAIKLGLRNINNLIVQLTKQTAIQEFEEIQCECMLYKENKRPNNEETIKNNEETIKKGLCGDLVRVITEETGIFYISPYNGEGYNNAVKDALNNAIKEIKAIVNGFIKNWFDKSPSQNIALYVEEDPDDPFDLLKEKPGRGQCYFGTAFAGQDSMGYAPSLLGYSNEEIIAAVAWMNKVVLPIMLREDKPQGGK